MRFCPFGIVSIGVCLGELKKGRIEPAHQFFKSYGNQFKNKIDLEIDSPLLALYLAGNEFDCDNESGYACILCCGVPVGGGKVVSGKVKNYYPKGLRGTIR